jgi:valyl-tRNA synthetase
MPHITEEIWSTFNKNYLIDSEWPTEIKKDFDVNDEIESLKEIITNIRNFKSNYNLKNSIQIELNSTTLYPEWFVNQLENIANVEVSDKKEDGVILTFQSNHFSFSLLANKYIDIDKEIKRLHKKIDELKKSLEISKKRLNNDKFIQNAKQELIDQENQNVQSINTQIDTIKSTLNSLEN